MGVLESRTFFNRPRLRIDTENPISKFLPNGLKRVRRSNITECRRVRQQYSSGTDTAWCIPNAQVLLALLVIPP